MLLGVGQASNRSGDADGFVAEGGKAGDDVLLGVKVHVGAGGSGSALAIVEEVGCAGMVADEHEASAAEVACLGKHDGEGETYGHGRIDGVAALLEDCKPGVRCVMVNRDDHGMTLMRFRGSGLLRGEGESRCEHGACDEGSDGLDGGEH